MPSTQHDTIPRLVIVSLLAGLALVVLAGGLAFAGVLPPGGTFTDDDGNVHEGNIEAIANAGITKGCNPPANDLYCPSSAVTRGQMAAFLVRALALPPSGTDHFIDDDDSIFENDINSLAASSITKGCNPPANSRFCPDSKVSREQMAAFLVRALNLTDDGGGDLFIDDDTSIFESDIDKLAAAGITKGCNPPSNTRYCPTDLVLRDQMASFLARALGLDPIDPPPTSTTTTTTTTTKPPNCDPSYPDFCIPPPPPDLNCPDIPQKNFTVLPPDPHNFDGNNNGIGCET
jgi:hypothetical protein